MHYILFCKSFALYFNATVLSSSPMAIHYEPALKKACFITVMHLPFCLNNQTTLLHTSVEYDCCTVVFSSTEFFLF